MKSYLSAFVSFKLLFDNFARLLVYCTDSLPRRKGFEFNLDWKIIFSKIMFDSLEIKSIIKL